MRRTIVIIAVLLGVILLIWVIASRGKSAPEVKVSVVERHDIVERVSASGKIYPGVEVAIIPEISGEVIQVFVEDGDSVKKGAPLLRLNPDIYQDALERAQASLASSNANLENARARLDQTKAQLEKAKADYDRSQALFDDKVISRSELEAAETAWKVARAEVAAGEQSLNAARHNVEIASASAREARTNLNRTTVFAPMTGVVTMLNVEEGKVVGGVAQMMVTEVMRLANFDDIEVRVDVGERDIIKVNIGDTCEIDVESYPGKQFGGVVTHLSSSSEALSQLAAGGATNYVVRIRLDRKDYLPLVDLNAGKVPFLPGMSASAEILTHRSKKVLSVPVMAVVYDSGQFVYVPEDGKASRRDVETGIQDDRRIEVLSGLKEHERVISGPYETVHHKLKTGASVDID